MRLDEFISSNSEDREAGLQIIPFLRGKVYPQKSNLVHETAYSLVFMKALLS